jgi:hypothetical protein
MSEYVKTGPSHRIKRSVAPVKVLITNKQGTQFYQTKYAGVAKHKEYDEHIRATKGTEGEKKYEKYIHKSREVMKAGKLQPEFQKNMGMYWARNHAEASGSAYAYLNKVARLSPSVAVENSVFGKNTHAIKFTDGVSIATTVDMHNTNEGTQFSYKNDYTVGNSKFSSNITATAAKVGTQRELTINGMKGYDKDDISAFVTNMRNNFDKIMFTGQSTTGNPDTKYDLIQLGFFPKEDRRKFYALKGHTEKGIDEATGLSMSQKAILKGNLKDSGSFAAFMQNNMRSGFTGTLPQVMKTFVDNYIVLTKADTLTHSSQKSEFGSGKTLHTTMLQRDADNDAHKGYIRSKNDRTKL